MVSSRGHTVGAGSDRLLVFLVGYENKHDDIGINAVSYDGESLTRIAGDVAISNNNFLVRVELWYLDEAGISAASGNSFSVTFGGPDPRDEHYAAATYAGVDQTSPVFDSATDSTPTGNPNPIEETVSTAQGGMSVAGAYAGKSSSYFTRGNGWTEGIDQSQTSSRSSSADNPSSGAGSDTASATANSPNPVFSPIRKAPSQHLPRQRF